MFRRLLALLLLVIMFPAALAEDFVPYQVFTFAGQLPDPLKAPLASLIPDESRILSGAAIQQNGYDTAPTDTNARACYSALVLVDGADGLRLYAAAQPEGLPWQVNDYSRFLRGNRNSSVSVYMPEPSRIPCLSIDYGTPDGLISDLFVFWNKQLWCIKGHINSGHNITIGNEMGMLSVSDAAGRESFRCHQPYFLDYMADLSAFPITRAEAQSLSWLPVYTPYSTGMTLYCKGANLRREPTTKSASLGMYARNVPMVFTGEEKQGSTFPWYQVHIGGTTGWMSGNYVANTPDWSFEPIPLGRTVDGCPLYAAPGDSQPAAQLEPVTTFHILTEVDGMYHICIPRENISWAVDQEGAYGYIPVKDILQGAGPSALDALESAR